MRVVRDKDQGKIFVFSEDGKLQLEFGFFADEFTMIFHTPHVVIKKEEDESFYSSFVYLLKQKYQFQHDYSYQKKDFLVWLSDEYGDLEDPHELSTISRLIMEKKEDQLRFSVQKPIFSERGFPTQWGVVSFSPAGNGYWSLNPKTGKSFQTEMIEGFRNALDSRKVKIKGDGKRE